MFTSEVYILTPKRHLLTFVAVTFLAVGVGVGIHSYKTSLARVPSKGVHTCNVSNPETRATTLEATIFPGSLKENAVAIHQTSSHALANVASSSKTPFKTPVAEIPQAGQQSCSREAFGGPRCAGVRMPHEAVLVSGPEGDQGPPRARHPGRPDEGARVAGAHGDPQVAEEPHDPGVRGAVDQQSGGEYRRRRHQQQQRQHTCARILRHGR